MPTTPNINALEHRIDEMVYKLYVLTLEEIANVERMQGIAYILYF
jgi:hypothetical protein